MTATRTSTQQLFQATASWVAATYPGLRAEQITIRLSDGRKVQLPLPHGELPVLAAEEEPFVPSPFQVAILAALEGRAMRTDALGAEVRDRSRLFRHPGGIKELQEQGLVAHHKRLGYYSTSAPPPELLETVGE